MHESLALDTSQDSGKMTACVNSPESNDESDATSDWDSWEDEDEVKCTFSRSQHWVDLSGDSCNEGGSIYVTLRNRAVKPGLLL